MLPTSVASFVPPNNSIFVQEVDDNDDQRIVLAKRVIDFLLLIRDYCEHGNANIPPTLIERLQEFEK